jgi:glycosyltransferase involved in cell wall biosynthesis
MLNRKSKCELPEERGPLRVLFAITSIPVGGAETLLVNLVRRMDRRRFQPEICCLKEPGPLGEQLASEMPVYSGFLESKYDLRVVSRLRRLMVRRQTDALVTVGAGDKMFWGRLAAWRARVPVVLSALHSTGWPDGVGTLNRCLTPLTDGFIAVAKDHGRFLIEEEGFPANKVHVIPNGVDTQRFCPNPVAREAIRHDLRIHADVPVFGIVAALRPEKNHLLFLRAAKLIRQAIPDAMFLLVGDGPQREQIKVAVASAGLHDCVRLLGSRGDIPDLLAAMDVFVLSSRMEANPVSILEAMAAGLPVVATRVGSVFETVHDGRNGYLVQSGDAESIARHCIFLASRPDVAQRMGQLGRQVTEQQWSVDCMVEGYQQLIVEVYQRKRGPLPDLATEGPRSRDRGFERTFEAQGARSL